MYWVWEPLIEGDDVAMIYGVPDALLQVKAKGSRFDFGMRVLVSVPPILIVRNDDSLGRLNDNVVAPGLTGLLLSSRLRDALAAAGVDNIDYYPVRIDTPQTGDSTVDYALANVVGTCACVDFAASDVTIDSVEPGKIRFIESLVLDEARIHDARMFRLFEHLQVVVVHDNVKSVCESNGVTGVRFVRPADFSL
jgi:hypothetical protein